jgi:hypothetical protein
MKEARSPRLFGESLARVFRFPELGPMRESPG